MQLAVKPTIKSLLYMYRIAFTGIHLMTHGEVLLDVVTLTEHAPNPLVETLLERKDKVRFENPEDVLEAELLEAIMADLDALEATLIQSVETSPLPETAPHPEWLNDWLVRWRTWSVG